MPSLVTRKFDEDRFITKGVSLETSFPHYKSMGALCCHGNHSFDGICSKTSKQLFPHPTDETNKI